MQESIDSVHRHLERSRQMQTVLRAFEARDRNLLENNLWRVSFWSCTSVVVMLAVAFTQIYTLRRLFDDKRKVRFWGNALWAISTFCGTVWWAVWHRKWLIKASLGNLYFKCLIQACSGGGAAGSKWHIYWSPQVAEKNRTPRAAPHSLALSWITWWLWLGCDVIHDNTSPRMLNRLLYK